MMKSKSGWRRVSLSIAVAGLLLFTGCTAVMYGVGQDIDSRHTSETPIEWQDVAKGDHLKVIYQDSSAVIGMVVSVDDGNSSLVLSPNSRAETDDDLKITQPETQSLLKLTPKTHYRDYFVPAGIVMDIFLISLSMLLSSMSVTS